MSWTEIEKQLRQLPAEEILDLMKGLHDISPQNKAWLKVKLLPIAHDTKYLEDCRRKVAIVVKIMIWNIFHEKQA
jgi:hypothetical protein